MKQSHEAYVDGVAENYLCGDRLIVATYRRQFPSEVRSIHESELDWVKRCAKLDAESKMPCFPEVAQYQRPALGSYSLRLAA